MGASSSFTKISVLDKNGIAVASTDERFIGQDNSNSPSFLKGREETYIKDVHACKITGEPAISIATPIIEKGELLGVMIAGLTMTKLNAITTDRTGLGRSGEVYLVNKDGYMITPSRFAGDTFLKQKLSAEHLAVQVKGKIVSCYKDYRGREVLGTCTYIPEMQWYLVADIDREEAFAPVDHLTRIMIAIIAALVAMGIVAFHFSIQNTDEADSGATPRH